MSDPFVHLHVASGYSMQYGASSPAALVQRAVDHEMDTLALTDRDGAYGAIRFVKACQQAQISPVLGVDLAVAPSGAIRGPWVSAAQVHAGGTPARGGSTRDAQLPRVTFLACGAAGWAALCRLISAAHLEGERGNPVVSAKMIEEQVAGKPVVAMLGPASELGAAVSLHRRDLAEHELSRWQMWFGAGELAVEVVDHRLPGSGPGSAPHAARMAGLARARGVSGVLSNAVRYADQADAAVTDVLDSARRLVPLDLRHVDRRNAEGYLKGGKEMSLIAEEVARLSGLDREGRGLLAATRALAERCAIDPRADLGLGEIHFPELDGGSAADRAPQADQVLRVRCEGAIGSRYGNVARQRIWKRLDDELSLIAQLGYASYFLTVSDVRDLITKLGVRSAARGSGAGSLVNYLLGVSGVDPIRHGLLMERFLSPHRKELPDIDIDVESARRLEIYSAILDRYGGERCVAVAMMETYRVRHAIRDVGGALGMPRGEIDAIAKAFPHIRARDARSALRDLPELRASGLAEQRLGLLFGLVEKLDGLPRHIAMHPCGVLLSDATLLDRTPVESSYAGFPMSQFDKDDVEDLGLLKLDVLGIRMQSSMAHAVAEVKRVDGIDIDLDSEAQVPFDDRDTYDLISSAQTLGCFQIESPGQRELVGKSGIETFEEIITDISLFRPGPVKSDMITPYLNAKQGWRSAVYPHPDLKPILEQTRGVVVYHEQVIEIIALFAGCSYAEGDEARRALGRPETKENIKVWFFPRALEQGYRLSLVEQVWKILEAFGSFGFCKAHAAAFALPTYQSAWLKTHYPAHFLSGVLTHDPGMYPKRLILDDARHRGVEVLGLDVNRSEPDYRVEVVGSAHARYGIRISLGEVKGITAAEVERMVAARPFASLSDLWERARPSRPTAERLVLAGALDSLYGIISAGDPATGEIARRGRVTRRDLLLQVSDLDRETRAHRRATRAGGSGPRRSVGVARALDEPTGEPAGGPAGKLSGSSSGTWQRAQAQSRAVAAPEAVSSVQLSLGFDLSHEGQISGLPEMSASERVQAELEVLGLDASRHLMELHTPLLDELGVVRSNQLLTCRSQSEVLIAGVKVATQAPPIRSGRRVVFLTLDDSTGPVDATFFEDVQGPYAATVFSSWLLVVRGEIRRTGRRGISVRATGCWELTALHTLLRTQGLPAVQAVVRERLDTTADTVGAGEGGRRVLVHTTGFKMSPYADIKPAGEDPGRKLWHTSPGTPG